MDQHMEILHGIVSAEQEARTKYEQAVQRQVSFEKDVAEHIQQLREQYYQSADESIARFEAGEKAKADKAIAALDAKHIQELEQSQADFQLKKEGYAQRLFEIVVNQNA